ncbi:MAG: cytochrome C oxidase subunit II [Gemmatimonadota bacterium]|nr:cytochrome C oxidase subunit II [Gemmatimonadota bacterium]
MFDSGITPARGIWWKPAHRTEKIWIAVAFVWCLILFAMMPLWHLKGGQNTTGIRHRVEPADFEARTNQFIADYQVGEEAGIPVVEPPPGADVYLLGKMWQWTPVLRLREGVQYRIHLSSIDVNHGFNLYPFNINFQVVPGYDYALDVTPTEAGDYRIVCNEFCGVGHHVMVGRIEVLPADGDAVAAAGGDR